MWEIVLYFEVQLPLESVYGWTLFAELALIPESPAAITATLVQAVPFDGCDAVTNLADLEGAIVLVGAGSCCYLSKISNIQGWFVYAVYAPLLLLNRWPLCDGVGSHPAAIILVDTENQERPETDLWPLLGWSKVSAAKIELQVGKQVSVSRDKQPFARHQCPGSISLGVGTASDAQNNNSRSFGHRSEASRRRTCPKPQSSPDSKLQL